MTSQVRSGFFTLNQRIERFFMGRLPSGVRRRKNGIFEKRISFKGKRISIYGRSIDIIFEKENQLRKKIGIGIYDKRNIILDDYFEEWINNKRLTIKENTICTYTSYYYNHISSYLGKRKMQEIDTRELRLFQNFLANKLKAPTANICFKILNAILNDAVIDGIILHNPGKGIKAIKENTIKATATYHRALTVKEQDILFNELKDEYYYDFLAFMLCSGMRSGEVAALTWKDIDYKEECIHINKTLTRTKEGKITIGNSAKTDAGERDIPLTDNLKRILDKRKNIKAKADYCDMVFLSRSGGLIYNAAINRAIQAAIKRIERKGTKIEHFTSHGLRDCYATRFIEQGGSMQTLKTLLGHKSITMTMDLYSHVLPNKKKVEAEKIKFNLS